jgi:hypothetical protein
MGLQRPEGLGDAEWDAISEAEQRLLRARAVADYPLIVGSSKELCEAIAKVVLSARGSLATAAADLPELVAKAHKLLEFQPGEGLATEPAARTIAQSLKSIVIAIGDMRNQHGTGHGRAVPSGIASEHADLANGAALEWSAWALRRLEPYIAGDVSKLVLDLEVSTFRRGDLARRLRMSDLPRLSEEDQRRLGFAVAGRASRETFVVIADGVEAVQADDEVTWPRAYVEGLITGLFLDANGRLDVNEWKAREAARLIAALRNPADILRDLIERIEAAVRSGAVIDDDADLTNAARELRGALPDGEARLMLDSIAGTVAAANSEDRRAWLWEELFRTKADPKAGWQEDAETDYGRGADAIRDYEGAPIEWEGTLEQEPERAEEDDPRESE